jgi:hypothetical protein
MPTEPGHPFYAKPPSTEQGGLAEYMVPNAVQYIAHQAYHIRRALERIADAMETKA